MSEYQQRIQPMAGARSELIINAAYRMARVFVRLFSPYLQTSVLAEMVTQAGVEAAHEQCSKDTPKKKVTLSRLSMITGVATKTIKSILQQPKQIADYHVCAEAAILARWSKDPALQSAVTGQPADLPIFGNDGSFQSLVSRHAGRGISTPTVLNRLISTGNIKTVNKHFVRMVNPHWRFFEDQEDEVLDASTHSLSSLSKALLNNLKNRNQQDQKWVERRVYSVNIPSSEVSATKAAMNELLRHQYEDMVNLIRSRESKSNHEATELLGTGYYFWRSDL
jgi:signal transduction protein with GAF and PtsI domain